MKHLRLLALLALAQPAIAEYHPPIEYGVAATIDFVLYNTDGTLDVDEVDGGTEVTIFCDGDSGTTATNDFVDEGSYYSIALTSGETECARVTLEVAATDTNVVIVPTFGNASAQVNYDGAGYTEAGGTGDQLTAVATASALSTAQSDLDTITGSDGVTLATTQGNYAPATASALSTAQSDLDTITGSDGVTLATTQGNYAPATAAAVAALENLSQAEAQTAAAAALTAYDPPTNTELTAAVGNVSVDELQATAIADLFNTDSGTDYASAVSGSAVAEIADNAGGSALTAGGIADAVWDEARSGHNTAGTFGEYVLADVQLWDGNGTLTALEDADDLADAVWDEALSGHATSGTTGEALSSASAGGGLDAAGVRSAIGLSSANLDTQLSTIDGNVDDIETAVGSLATASALATAQNDLDTITGSDGVTLATTQGNYAPATAAAVAALENLSQAEAQTAAAAALTAYDPPTDTEMDSAFSALNDLSAAEVNTQVDTAIETYHLDHLFATDYDPSSKPGTSTALLNELVENDSGVSQFTANALEEAPTGSGASVSAIADAVWTEALADHSGSSGSAAEALSSASAGGGLDAAGVRSAIGLSSANLDTQLSTIDGNVDDIETAVGSLATASALATAQNDLDTITGSDGVTLATTQGNYAPATAAAVAALPTAVQVRDAIMQYVIENGLTFEQMICAMGAYQFGESDYTAGSPNGIVYDDHSGTDTRLTVQFSSNDRTDVTVSTVNCGSN